VESLVDAPHEKAQRRERWKANAVRVSDLCQLPSIDREMEAMSDAKLSSKERLYDEAFSLLQRAQALLERAQKRHTELEAMNTALIKGIASLDSSPDEPSPEHPPQLMAVVDKWQDYVNDMRNGHIPPYSSQADTVECVLREIRRAAQPPGVYRFKVGDRVEWTTVGGGTKEGEIAAVSEPRYVVIYAIDEKTPKASFMAIDSDLRPALTKSGDAP
jgi:hypothetical protein